MANARMINLNSWRAETVTIAVAGTAQTPTAFPVPDGIGVVVRAHPSNTGRIKLGNSAANAQDVAGNNNVPLTVDQAITLQVNDASRIYIDAVNSGDKAIIYFEF